MSLQDALVGATSNIFSVIYNFLPNLLGAILVFLVGLILASWVKALTIRVLNSINLSKLSKNTDFEKFLKKAEVKSQIEEIVGNILKWVLILIFTVAAINILGLPTISTVLNNILAYIPNVVSAIFVLAIGVLLAGFIERLVKGAVAQIDARMGRLLGKIASYTMIVLASMAAFNELGIAKEFINILFIGFVAMLALGLGLAIGLGAKDVVSEILMQWYKRFRDEVKGK
ncbi:MAG: mechanosensitive ion channel family protein [Patescibacteria group bacterium]